MSAAVIDTFERHGRLKTVHPVADILPLLEGSSFDDLVCDIRTHGLREAIVLHPDGSILDGRNRYRACEAAGVEPRYRTWDGVGSPIAYVVSLNLHRRHLDESQRALVAARIATLPHGGDRTTEQTANLQDAPTRAEAGAMVNVSERSVNSARRVLEGGSRELIHAVEQGHVAVSVAAQVVEHSVEQQQHFVSAVISGTRPAEALRQTRRAQVAANMPMTGKFRVVYADPPWHYGNAGVVNDSDSYGRAERHYPTMSIEELCALPVQEHLQENAVLFLWVTSPLLVECAPVISAWGFTYKTSMVWDKVEHNYGHYVSVRHELLLIGTRGSCLPDHPTPMPDSVVVVPRSETHSEKPHEMRQLIERLYDGPRVELFARTHRAGWQTWGNQVAVTT